MPVLNEAAALPGLLADLRGLRPRPEVIVVDGGSADATCRVAREHGALVLTAARGRGTQLRAGAAAARAPLLCFLHADVRLAPPALRMIEALAKARPPGAYAFRLAIDRPGLAYRVVEWGANVRSRWGGLPYGDQGLLVRREDYDAAGGYPPVPLMEDVGLVRALRRTTRIHILPAVVQASARRWEREGVLRRSWANWRLLLAYFRGVPPERLATHYRPAGEAPPPSRPIR
ncbi:MAG: TIGR04283 family arsenosugar biosynthesis glycosyltransferase [Deltaproteobacteria bacterium]